jgi:hypothetical protein
MEPESSLLWLQQHKEQNIDYSSDPLYSSYRSEELCLYNIWYPQNINESEEHVNEYKTRI